MNAKSKFVTHSDGQHKDRRQLVADNVAFLIAREWLRRQRDAQPKSKPKDSRKRNGADHPPSDVG